MEKKLMVAKSYRGAERIGEPFEKNSKLYQKIKEKCDRCSGHGIIVARVENGQPIPIPVDGGVCYSCWGKGYFIKEVRLYTEEEYNKIETANERARQKKEAEREAKMKAEFAENERKWKLQNGWSEDGISYIVSGDSYSIKDELKEAGFIFDPVMRWHKAIKDEKYADRLIEVHLDELCDISAWGKGTYRSDAKSIVNAKLAETQPQIESDWIGEIGEKIKDIPATVIKKISFEGRYGITTLISFQIKGGILNWFTSTNQLCEVGDEVRIKYATIKKHDEYKGVKNTVITRAKVM